MDLGHFSLGRHSTGDEDPYCLRKLNWDARRRPVRTPGKDGGFRPLSGCRAREFILIREAGPGPGPGGRKYDCFESDERISSH